MRSRTRRNLDVRGVICKAGANGFLQALVQCRVPSAEGFGEVELQAKVQKEGRASQHLISDGIMPFEMAQEEN